MNVRLCVGACLLGFAVNAQQATPPLAEPLLDEVMAAYRAGDLAGAWDAFAVFFEHPSRNDLHVDAFAACFYDKRCPQPGAVGRILGKPRAELAERINGFCPRLRDPEVEAALLEAGMPERELAQWRKGYERIVRNGFNGTCEEWRREQRRLLWETPQLARIEPDVLPITWYERQLGGFSVAINAMAGSSPLRLGVDTGSTYGVLHRQSPSFPTSEVRIESGPARSSMGISHYVISMPARLASLRVGATLLQPYALDVTEDELLWQAHPVPEVGFLGMAFLLRHRAVCFAWEEQRLYLGSLGPCAVGVQPREALLRGSLAVGFVVEARNGERFTVSVDTGASHTNCSAAFAEAQSGNGTFSIGDHPSLAAECVFNEAVLYKKAQYGFPQIFVRMNYLLRFRAFGWALNPLRVYFVPRAEAPDAQARSAGAD